MKISKKALGAAMSVVMLGSQVMPVLASGSAVPTAPTTTGGTANILDYKVESVVVPTALKITLNPKGYDITTKYVEATSYAANTVYYTESAGTYTKATVADAAAFGSGGPYYTAETTDDQVVSLNYGVANKSTGAKSVKVDFAATYTAVDGKKAIEFVDSEAKAQAYDATNNADGAKAGEHKMYLAVASAAALPTANTYAKTADTTVDNGKTYYTKSGAAYTKVDSPVADDLGTYYEATTTIGTEITAAELADVTMTKAATGNQVFVKGATDKADASIAYSLGAATYGLKDGETIDFTTTQADLASKLEMSVLGEVAGFTLTGAVNADADWTEADATAITITPTYTIADATGAEAAVDSGAYKQVTLNAGPSAPATVNFDTTNGATFDVNFGLGESAATQIKSIQYSTDGTTYKTFGTPANVYTISGKTVTIKPSFGGFDANNEGHLKVVFDKGDAALVTLEKQP